MTPARDPARDPARHPASWALDARASELSAQVDRVPGSLGPTPAAPPLARPHTLHLVLQHQGRAGGSLVASLVAQYHEARGLPVRGFDLAPLAPGFARHGRFGALGVRPLVRTDRDRWAFDRSFGALLGALERAITASVTGAASGGSPRARSTLGTPVTAVADVGPAAFLAFFECCAEEPVREVLAALDARAVLHAVAPAGAGVPWDVAACYARDLDLPPDTAAVVWRNHGPGPAARRRRAVGTTDAAACDAPTRDAPAGDALAAALAVRYRVAGVVHVPTLPGPAGRERDVPDAASHDHELGHDPEYGPLTGALVDALPFAEALRAPWPDSPARRRLRAARDGVFAQLAQPLASVDPAT